jgi:tRNA-dihydrouridine synthase
MVNPFLFRDLRNFFEHGEARIDDTERLSALASFILRYLTYLKEREGETRLGSRVGTFKEFATWFSRNPLIGKSFFQSVKRLSTLSEIETTARTFFEDPPTQEVMASR